MKTALKMSMGQGLHLTPQLLQSIKLLQLPALELEQAVHDALERNVMLEADDNAEADADEAVLAEVQQPEPAQDVPEIEWMEMASSALGSAAPLEDDEGFEARRAAPEPSDARLKILAQLRLTLEDKELAIGECLLDQVDDTGYLEQPLADVMAAVQQQVPATPVQILGVRRHLQRLEPAGYGSRNLRECLLIQLEMLGPNMPGRTIAMRLVSDHLDAIADADAALLASALDTDVEHITRALRLIRTLSPKPGLAGTDTVAEAIIPDVIVRRAGRGGWHVELAHPAASRVRVNGLYEQLLGRCKSGEHARVLRDQLQEARWLVRGLQMRHQTLLRTVKVLVERQGAFLERGAEGLRPLTLREVADAIGMHESTVSRITTQKYVQTPRGVFELKAFFSNAMRDEGTAASGAAVRAMVRRLIEAESPATPLADGVIARLLERHGVRIARRTVSKYREALRIPAARERRAHSC